MSKGKSDCSGSWICEADGRCELVLNGDVYKGVMVRAVDGAQGASVPCFTVINEKGEAVWGIRYDDLDE